MVNNDFSQRRQNTTQLSVFVLAGKDICYLLKWFSAENIYKPINRQVLRVTPRLTSLCSKNIS